MNRTTSSSSRLFSSGARGIRSRLAARNLEMRDLVLRHGVDLCDGSWVIDPDGDLDEQALDAQTGAAAAPGPARSGCQDLYFTCGSEPANRSSVGSRSLERIGE